MNAIRAAILILCRNDAENLDQLLRALNRQSIRKHLRIIVVDNNSSDNTLEVAQALADTALHEPRKGIGFARNKGLAEIVEPYMLCLDSDVRPATDQWAKHYVDALDALPESVIGVTGPVFPMPVPDRWAQRSEMTPRAPRDPTGQLLYAVGCNNALRVQSVRAVGSFDEEGADDAGFGGLARSAGFSFEWVEEAGAFHQNLEGLSGYWAQMKKVGRYSAGLHDSPEHPAAQIALNLSRACWWGSKSLVTKGPREGLASFLRPVGQTVGAMGIWRQRSRPRPPADEPNSK